MPSLRILFALIGAGLAVGPGAWAQPAEQTSCVDVKIGMEQYYNCLNKRLARAVEQHPNTARDAPFSAASPGPAVGSFNQAATRERLGSAFGHSAIPQRPAPVVYPPPK